MQGQLNPTSTIQRAYNTYEAEDALDTLMEALIDLGIQVEDGWDLWTLCKLAATYGIGGVGITGADGNVYVARDVTNPWVPVSIPPTPRMSPTAPAMNIRGVRHSVKVFPEFADWSLGLSVDEPWAVIPGTGGKQKNTIFPAKITGDLTSVEIERHAQDARHYRDVIDDSVDMDEARDILDFIGVDFRDLE